MRVSGLGALAHGTGKFDMAQGKAVFRAEKGDGVVIRAPLTHHSVAPRVAPSSTPSCGCTTWRRCSGTKTTCSSTSGATSRCSACRGPRSRHARAGTRVHAGAGGGARWCGGAHRARDAKVRRRPADVRCQHGEMGGQKKGRCGFFPRPRGGADGICKRRGRAGVRTQRRAPSA